MGLITDIKTIASQNTDRKDPNTSQAQSNFYNPNPTPGPEAAVKENPAQTTGKLTQEEAEETGMTNAYLLTSIFEGIHGGVLFYKHYKRFTPEEKDLLAIANSKDPSKCSEAEIKLLQKASKLNEKYEKQKEKVETDEETMERLEKGFTKYAQVTGKKTTPTLMLAAIITKFCTDKALDIFLD